MLNRLNNANIMHKQELWDRIKNYKFNNLVPHSTWADIIEVLGDKNASTRAFATKIMKKHWLPRAFVFRAIEKYKKFVYLGVVSDFYVTPSKYIDLIWHEHILFSKAYREFCNEVIRYQFGHQPELVATQDQTELFAAQYIETIELYSKEFGMEPPENIWGVPKFNKTKVNFANRSKQKINTKKTASVTGYATDPPLYSFYNDFSASEAFSGLTEETAVVREQAEILETAVATVADAAAVAEEEETSSGNCLHSRRYFDPKQSHG